MASLLIISSELNLAGHTAFALFADMDLRWKFVLLHNNIFQWFYNSLELLNGEVVKLRPLTLNRIYFMFIYWLGVWPRPLDDYKMHFIHMYHDIHFAINIGGTG